MPSAGSNEILADRNEESLCDSCAFRTACTTKEDVAARYRIPTSNVRMSKCEKFQPSSKKEALYKKIKRIAAPLY